MGGKPKGRGLPGGQHPVAEHSKRREGRISKVMDLAEKNGSGRNICSRGVGKGGEEEVSAIIG